MPVHPEYLLCVGLFTLAAAITDFRCKRVPNYLTVPAALAGLAYHTLAPGGQGVLFALAGFAIGFGLLLLPWILGGGGRRRRRDEPPPISLPAPNAETPA